MTNWGQSAGSSWYCCPARCVEGNVRDVVGHLVGMDLVFVAMFERNQATT